MITTLLAELLAAIGFKLGEKAVEESVLHRQALIRFIKCSSLYRTRQLRVSFSDLLWVKSGELFLLIQNAKRPQQFGPIGGTIKYFHDAAAKLQEQFGFKDEVTSGPDRRDLRGFIQGSKFSSLLRWFNTGEEREKQALAREIQEEMQEIGLASLLPRVSRFEFKLIRRIHEGPTKVRGRNYWQYRLFSVYQLYEHDSESAAFIKALISLAPSNEKLLLASVDDIKTGRAGSGQLIGDHSGYLFGKDRVGYEPPPYK